MGVIKKIADVNGVKHDLHDPRVDTLQEAFSSLNISEMQNAIRSLTTSVTRINTLITTINSRLSSLESRVLALEGASETIVSPMEFVGYIQNTGTSEGRAYIGITAGDVWLEENGSNPSGLSLDYDGHTYTMSVEEVINGENVVTPYRIWHNSGDVYFTKATDDLIAGVTKYYRYVPE